LLLATVLAFLSASTVTTPLLRLTREMDRRAAATALPEPATHGEAEALAPGTDPTEIANRAPQEIARLAAAFHHLLEQLRGAEKRLADTERLATLGRLSATVAHELKNPLSGIKMNLRVLRDELEQRGITDATVAVMDHEIDRMDLYLQELMLLARPDPIDAGTGTANQEVTRLPVALGDVAESVLMLMAARCAHSQIRVEREFRPAPPVTGDPAQLRQVILNLVLNALEAMPTGGVLGVVIDSGEHGVTCTVTDTGNGVRAPPGTDIFAPFTTTKNGSAGLGLYVCRRIVAAHGGRIGYDDRGAGARFWVEVPMAERRANA
jgi:signal transduction histidine kinase